jgi:hypothetical protein
MVRTFLYGILTGMLLSPSGRKKVAVKGIRMGNKLSRYVRDTGTRIKEDWKDAVVEAETIDAEIVETEKKPTPEPAKKPSAEGGKPPKSS